MQEVVQDSATSDAASGSDSTLTKCQLGVMDLGLPKWVEFSLVGALAYDDVQVRSLWVLNNPVGALEPASAPGQYAGAGSRIVIDKSASIEAIAWRDALSGDNTTLNLPSLANYAVQVYDKFGMNIGMATYPGWPDCAAGKCSPNQFAYTNGAVIFATRQAPVADPKSTPTGPSRLRLYGVDLASGATWTVVRPTGPEEWPGSAGAASASLHPLKQGGWLVLGGGVAWEVAPDGTTVSLWKPSAVCENCPANFPDCCVPAMRYVNGRVLLTHAPSAFWNAFDWGMATTSGVLLTWNPVPNFQAIDVAPGVGGTVHVTKHYPGIIEMIHVLVVGPDGRPIALINNAYPKDEFAFSTPARPTALGMLRAVNSVLPQGVVGTSGLLLTDWWYNPSCETSGPCWQKTYADCSDQDPCTSDLCDAAHNGCYHVPLPDGITCSDAGGHCAAGTCK